MTDPKTILPRRKHSTAGSLLGVKDLVGSPESVSQARAYVRGKLGEDHPALDDVTLLVSEVVTNAVIHSNSRNGGRVTLALADCYDFIHVDVVDEGGEMIPQVGAGIFAESGRGLMLVEQISDHWDVYEDSAGRTVWFQVRYERVASCCPMQRTSAEPSDPHESATRRTAKQAARTVAESAQQEQALRLVERWGLDRDGLDMAAETLGVEPFGHEGTRL
ncbi:ATP-binding protein [Sphaerisporangium sp. NBC_01403]|uniref:ATP-binding protein n=1 Tax=Sphaerisporangium sp. NBC_01403 TaxID=2903599 RepID=UPI00325386DC